MENLDIIILTTIVSTLFAVFFILMYKEFSKMEKEEYKSELEIKQKIDSSHEDSVSKQVLQNYLLLPQNAHGLSVLRVAYCQGLS